MAKARSASIQISRKGMLVWIGLFLFVAVWMFVLGIMVGRGIAPVDLEKDKLGQELAALKAKMLQQEQAKVEKQVSGQGGEKPQLGFYEALKDSKGEKRYKAPAVPKPKPKPAPKPASKPTSKPRPEPKAVVKKAPAPKPAAETVSKPAAKKASSTDKGRFAIQVAAVKDAQRAAQLVAQLRKKGYRAYQIRSEVAGKGVWYRVRVGAYETRNAAGATLGKLKADRYAGMIIGTR